MTDKFSHISSVVTFVLSMSFNVIGRKNLGFCNDKASVTVESSGCVVRCSLGAVLGKLILYIIPVLLLASTVDVHGSGIKISCLFFLLEVSMNTNIFSSLSCILFECFNTFFFLAYVV